MHGYLADIRYGYGHCHYTMIDPISRPLPARLLAKLAESEDAGLGDTIERLARKRGRVSDRY